MAQTGLLTTAEIANRAGVSVRTVGRWVRAGRITPVQVLPGKTGAMLFAPKDVDALLSEQAA